MVTYVEKVMVRTLYENTGNHGSPKGKGSGYRAVKLIKKRMKC